MWENPRQSWIVGSKPGIPDSTYWIPVFVSRTWIPDSYRFAIRIYWVVFRVPKPRIPIPDTTSNNFPVSGIQIPFHGAWHCWSSRGPRKGYPFEPACFGTDKLHVFNFKVMIFEGNLCINLFNPNLQWKENLIFFCAMPSKNCWKALSKRFHVSSNIKGIHPQTQKLEAPCTA